VVSTQSTTRYGKGFFFFFFFFLDPLLNRINIVIMRPVNGVHLKITPRNVYKTK
jgi:hypothetical protein